MRLIHHNLAELIKSDAKLIKSINPKFKTANILNEIAIFFGWRHYHELSISDRSLKNNQIKPISSLSHEEIIKLETDYCYFICKEFYSYLETASVFYNNNLFRKIKINSDYFIDLGKKEFIDLNLSTIHNIKFNNTEFSKLLHNYLDSKLDKQDGSSKLWFYRALNTFNDFKALADINNLNYQEHLLKFFDVNYLSNYLKYNKINMKGLCDYKAILSIPDIQSIYNDKDEITTPVFEMIRYLSMYFFAPQNLFKNMSKNKIELSLSEIKDMNKNISLTIPKSDFDDVLVDYLLDYFK